jgi:hypothetical protein
MAVSEDELRVATQCSFLSQPLQFKVVLANRKLVERLGKHQRAALSLAKRAG